MIVYYFLVMRRLAARLLLVFVGLFLGLLMVEAAFRLAGPNVPLDLTMARFQAYHPVYGFFHQPAVSGWVRTDEFTSFVKFNTQGLRGPEVAIPKPADTFRALVLGDSVVEGAQVAEDTTMAGRLRAELTALAGGRRVETVNAGVAGFGTGQQLLFLEREGLAYQPDLIVLVFTIANDPADNSLAVAQRHKLAAERRPFFVLQGDKLELRPFQAPPPEQWSGLRTFLRDRSVVFTALELWWIGKSVARAQGDVVPPEDAEHEVYFNEVGDDWRSAWEVTDALLARVQATADAADVPLLLVLSPSELQVYDDLWAKELGDTSQSRRRYSPGVPNERLTEIAARHGITLLDLRPTFRAEVAAGAPPVIFRKDGHWTEHGHAVAARAVVSAVQQHGLTRAAEATTR
ncbi:MAG TPA: SGNH/GDSL hydrolase family protein [Chloroflexota bacterium]|nr:SGNH/GDSL hydrolase family protein [Chloroflexota bacterium]